MGGSNSIISEDMGVACISLLPSHNQSMMRSAGSTAGRAFNHVVNAGYVPVYVENLEQKNECGLIVKEGGASLTPKEATQRKNTLVLTRTFPTNLSNLQNGRPGCDQASRDREEKERCSKDEIIKMEVRNRIPPGTLPYPYAVVINCLLLPKCPHEKIVNITVCGVFVDKQFQYLKFKGLDAESDIRKRVSIDSDFLGKYPAKSIEFCGGLSRVTKIGAFFMKGCTHIEEVDMPNLESLEYIGTYFMTKCLNLRSICLRGMYNVRKLGSCFMKDNPKLQTVSLDGLVGITSIESKFLAGCGKLWSVRMGELPNVEVIEESFLYACPSLSVLVLGNLTSLRTIGNDSLTVCGKLAGIQFISPRGMVSVFPSPLPAFRSPLTMNLPANFAQAHINIVPTAYFCYDFLANVTEIGRAFMAQCNLLEEFSLMGMTKLERIGNHFASSCPLLGSITIPSKHLVCVGSGFGYKCPKLKSVHFVDPCEKLEAIGDHFLSMCTDLVRLEMCGMSSSNLTVGKNFLYGCTSLAAMSLEELKGVKRIEPFFMSGCSSLQEIDLSPLMNVTCIGSNFMSECGSLSEVRGLTKLTKVVTVESDFFLKSPCLKVAADEVRGVSSEEPVVAVKNALLLSQSS